MVEGFDIYILEWCHNEFKTLDKAVSISLHQKPLRKKWIYLFFLGDG